MSVGQASVVEHLQEHIEHVVMGLLDLVEQDHAVGPAMDRFGQDAAFLIADVARRRADHAGDRVLLHELAHVDPHEGRLVVEEKLGQGFAQLGLAHAGRTEEEERADRPVGVAQPGPAAANRVGHRAYRVGLTDDAGVQPLLHLHQLFLLALEQA